MIAGFDFFKLKVANQLRDAGFKGDAEAFAECLDMSYDNIKHVHHTEWNAKIAEELAEFKAENPHEFETQH